MAWGSVAQCIVVKRNFVYRIVEESRMLEVQGCTVLYIIVFYCSCG